jgi:hypothetical protein
MAWVGCFIKYSRVSFRRSSAEIDTVFAAAHRLNVARYKIRWEINLQTIHCLLVSRQLIVSWDILVSRLFG